MDKILNNLKPVLNKRFMDINEYNKLPFKEYDGAPTFAAFKRWPDELWLRGMILETKAMTIQ